MILLYGISSMMTSSIIPISDAIRNGELNGELWTKHASIKDTC